MKRPSFQFYPGDWQSNQKLRRCSPAARGAWLDILCVLHDCDEYGVARYPLRELCRAAGVDLKHARELVDRGVLKGSDGEPVRFTWAPSHAGRKGADVVLVESASGPCWYCSRFVVDEYKRQRRGESTRFDSDGNQPSRRPNAKPNPKPMGVFGDGEGDGPSSSSSSSTTPESLPERTRDARAPAQPDARLVGTFEGHPDPPPNPAAPLAVALNRAGFRCTAMNPDLIAYRDAGGTVEHLLAVAEHPDCTGKAATYVIRFARRELTQPAKPITTHPSPRPTAAAPSRTLQGLAALEQMKHGTLVPERDPDRPAEAVHALAGPDAGG